MKILKRKRDFRDFRYRYALLQKIKNVVIICEYIFDFLKKCVPITELADNPISVSGFLLKMRRLFYNVDFGMIC